LQRVFADKQDGFASLQTSPANRNNDCDGKPGALTAESEELADFQHGAAGHPGGGASQQNLNSIKSHSEISRPPPFFSRSWHFGCSNARRQNGWGPD
jgi:hypothetical protein